MNIKVTPAALEKFKQFLDADNSTHVRIGIKGGGCSGAQYSLTLERFVDDNSEENIEFEQEGVRFVTDIFSREYLDGVTIDYKETLKESGFAFDNPLFDRGCGCGKSFSI